MTGDDRGTLLVRRATSWWLVGPVLCTLVALAEIGARLPAPPVSLVLNLFTAAALIALAKVAVWVGTSHQTFKREERLAVVVCVLVVGGSWYGTRIWTFERQFDALVVSQNRNFKLTLDELSGRILVFVSEETRDAPPAPRAATWDQDEGALLRYRQTTQRAFEAEYGSRVRAAHDVLRLFALTDRDFERFYRQPSDTFEMRIVANKLAFFSAKIPGT
ncbi:MAG TPA: hypothetical protein VHZ73_10250 [Vicinamibacterales bacterium]|nr:hypothetical protein [Vicinamibacterales bacterium]